jgi:hypothetical protein
MARETCLLEGLGSCKMGVRAELETACHACQMGGFQAVNISAYDLLYEYKLYFVRIRKLSKR